GSPTSRSVSPAGTPRAASAASRLPPLSPSSCAATPPNGSPARCTRSTAGTSPRCSRDPPGGAAFPGGPSIQLSLVRPVLLSRPMAPPARTRRRKPASRRGRSSRRRGRARPSAWARTREAAGHQLRGHGADTLAVALVVLGVLTVLGLASDLAGSVGSFLADGSAALLGKGRIAFPLACFGFAGLLFAGYLPHRLGDEDVDDEPVDDEDGDAKSPAPLRIGLGVVLVVLSVVGLLHLAGGRPPVDASDQVRDAGGLLGAAVAAPLASVAGVVGTAVILVGIGLLGLLLAPGVPMRRVLGAISGGFRWVAGAVGELLQLGADQPAADTENAGGRGGGTAGYHQDGHADTPPAHA